MVLELKFVKTLPTFSPPVYLNLFYPMNEHENSPQIPWTVTALNMQGRHSWLLFPDFLSAVQRSRSSTHMRPTGQGQWGQFGSMLGSLTATTILCWSEAIDVDETHGAGGRGASHRG